MYFNGPSGCKKALGCICRKAVGSRWNHQTITLHTPIRQPSSRAEGKCASVRVCECASGLGALGGCRSEEPPPPPHPHAPLPLPSQVRYPGRQRDVTADTIKASSDGSCFTDLSTFCTGSTAIFLSFITEAILV